MKRQVDDIFGEHNVDIQRHESLKKLMKYKYPEEAVQDRIRKFREQEELKEHWIAHYNHEMPEDEFTRRKNESVRKQIELMAIMSKAKAKVNDKWDEKIS